MYLIVIPRVLNGGLILWYATAAAAYSPVSNSLVAIPIAYCIKVFFNVYSVIVNNQKNIPFARSSRDI